MSRSSRSSLKDLPLDPCEEPGFVGELGGYRVRELVGEGHTTLVLKAWDPNLQRTVALRVLKPLLAKQASARTRFLEDNRAGCDITHSNVIATYGIHDADPCPYAVMSFCEGVTLSEYLKSSHSIPFEEIRRIGSEITKGLQAVHDTGMSHGDLSP